MPGARPQQVQRLQVGAADEVHVAGLQRIDARRGVGDADELDLVEIRLALLEVVRVADQPGADAGLELLERERAGPVAGLPVGGAVVVGRQDRQVIVAGDKGEVGVGFAQREDHGFRPVRLDVGDRLEQRLGRRSGVLAHVMAERGHDVVGRHRPAVVEGRAAAQLEDPFAGAVGRLEAFGEVGHDVAGVGR
jgi:hypothetical protein